MPMDLQMTQKEQNLLLLEAVIPANEKFYVWCYQNGSCIATSCPEPGREVLERAFRVFGGGEKALKYAATQASVPLLIGSPIGMQWVIAFEPDRARELLFVMGPVFYSTPARTQVRAALHPYLNTLEDAVWVSKFMEQLPMMPVIPHPIFIRYVTMAHNALTGQQTDVSILLAGQDYAEAKTIRPPEKRDRRKIYQAERVMLELVRTGNINYSDALNQGSMMSPGVPVWGRGPLQQNKISIIVFTSLVCRAAMEGGLSPEIAYPLGDSYIEATVNSNDTGELDALAHSMYHDFIYRVRRLNANPGYSQSIQKCCDYIELNLNKRIELSDLAAITGYAPYYLSEKFKKETGVPLFLYARNAKIKRAKLLLESTDLSIKEIAEKLAFTTQNYFIKCFREEAGCSPTQYRKECSSQPAAAGRVR